MNIVIGLGRGKPGKGESSHDRGMSEHDQGNENEGEDEDAELTEYELGAESMRERACALAAMHGAGKRPAKSLDKMIEELPLDERESSHNLGDEGDDESSHEPNQDTKY